MSGSRRLIAALVLALGIAGGAEAAPPDDRILPTAMHQTDKARTLATKHARALRDLNAEIYHCMPWLEIQKHSIGFFKPRHVVDDSRYLSIRLYVDQDPSPQFASLPVEQRASAMFSRYVGPVLRRMTRHAGVRNDDTIDGFTVILEWLKQARSARGSRPVHETMAVFVEKVDAEEYISGLLDTPALAARARVLGWDGETSLGAIGVSAWDDDFVTKYRVQGYEPERGVVCSNH